VSLWRMLQVASRAGIVTEAPDWVTDPEVTQLGQRLDARVRALFGRSLHIREVDAGSCNGCEIEITALTNPYYDMERFGLHIVASPRHADCLLVTGPVTRNMVIPLQKTYEATPHPKIVIAVGDCAANCGVFAGGYGVAGRVADFVPVDVTISGCPPTPADLLRGCLTALDRWSQKERG
jgi:Ni,Fe-hydrogenase III small subunit